MNPGQQEPREQKEDSGFVYAVPFLTILAVLTVVSFIIPLRPTVSQMEKRSLAAFPEFSVSALVDGSYFDDISTWYSDTFPGREEWLSMGSFLTSLHGESEIAITGDLPVRDVAAVETEPPQSLEIPKETKPAPTPTEALTGTEPATEATEPQWGGVQMGEDVQIDMTGDAIVQIGDSAFNCVGFSQPMCDKYANSLNMLADQMAPLGKRVISAPAPTAIGIMVEKKYMEKLDSVDQGQTIDYVHSKMNDNVVKVDTHDAILPHNDEYVYFRTDHHWTARGAYYAYEAICEALGYEALALEDFKEWDQGEMEGSLYWRVANPRKLKLDNLYTYLPPYDIETEIHGVADGKLVQDVTNWPINAKYSAFICSDNPYTIITNHDLPDAPNAILIKDSFGNALAPFLAANYHKVYVVDYRKYNGKMGTAGWLAKTNDVTDIIFAPYVIGLQDGQGSNIFRNLCS